MAIRAPGSFLYWIAKIAGHPTLLSIVALARSAQQVVLPYDLVGDDTIGAQVVALPFALDCLRAIVRKLKTRVRRRRAEVRSPGILSCDSLHDLIHALCKGSPLALPAERGRRQKQFVVAAENRRSYRLEMVVPDVSIEPRVRCAHFRPNFRFLYYRRVNSDVSPSNQMKNLVPDALVIF